MDEIARYLAAMSDLDPGLTVNVARAVRRGRNTCYDIAEGKEPATVLNNARLRFDGGNAQVDEAKAKRIVEIVTDSGLLDAYRAGLFDGAPDLADLLAPFRGGEAT